MYRPYWAFELETLFLRVLFVVPCMTMPEALSVNRQSASVMLLAPDSRTPAASDPVAEKPVILAFTALLTFIEGLDSSAAWTRVDDGPALALRATAFSIRMFSL